MDQSKYNPLNGVKARLFYWPDPVGDTWVVSAIFPHDDQVIWYPLSVSPRMEDCLDAVMDLNKNLEDRAVLKKEPLQENPPVRPARINQR